MIVVSVPEPAISGNAIGTNVPDRGSGSDLKNSTPSTISSPRINITIDPPTANELISNPNIFSNSWPRKTNRIISRPDSNVTFTSFIPPSLSLILISKGTDPTISIIANNEKVTVKRSSKVQAMTYRFIQQPSYNIRVLNRRNKTRM